MEELKYTIKIAVEDETGEALWCMRFKDLERSQVIEEGYEAPDLDNVMKTVQAIQGELIDSPLPLASTVLKAGLTKE